MFFQLACQHHQHIPVHCGSRRFLAGCRRPSCISTGSVSCVTSCRKRHVRSEFMLSKRQKSHTPCSKQSLVAPVLDLLHNCFWVRFMILRSGGVSNQIKAPPLESRIAIVFCWSPLMLKMNGLCTLRIDLATCTVSHSRGHSTAKKSPPPPMLSSLAALSELGSFHFLSDS